MTIVVSYAIPVRDDALDFLQFVIFVPHLTAIPNYIGHGSVDDDITRDVKVGDAVVGINHSKACIL